MIRWKILMLDFNGTLVDDVMLNYLGVAAIFSKFGLPAPSLEEYRNEITADIVSFYYERGVPKNCTREEMNKIYDKALEKNLCHLRLMPHARLLLEYCKILKMKCVLITAAGKKRLAINLAQLKIENHFDHIVSDATEKDEAIKKVLKKYNLKPEDGIYVGDTVADVAAGKKAGVATIGFVKGYNSEAKIRAVQPDFVVDSLYDAFLIVDQGDAP